MLHVHPLVSRLRFVTVLTACFIVLGPGFVFGGGEAEEEAVEIADDQQAPELSALVADGALPPLEERLPANPMVTEPREEIGRYGGEIRTMVRSSADEAWLTRTVGHEGVVVWDFDWSEVRPGYASDFDVSDDTRQFTFTLRDGLRWSDGEPFTTDDIEWWYHNEALNEELNPATSSTWVHADEVAELEIIDDLTFRFTFAEPNSLFLDDLANGGGWVPTPRHYAEQFHADFNDDVHDIAAQEGFDDWLGLYDFLVIDGFHTNPDLPVMTAWRVVEGAEYTGEHTRVSYERNPYYYRVDNEGNQLPYIDRWHFDVFEDSEVVVLRVLAGEVDFHMRHITGAEHRPVLYDGMENGNYQLVDRIQSNTVYNAISLNMTHEDDTVRELARNRDFRVGLSHAIDREEIAEIMHAGVSWGRQPAPYDTMDFYHEELAKQYTEYDRDLANQYLDDAGYEMNADGYRIGPDGEPIVIRIDVTEGGRVDVMEMIQQRWEEVGIQLEINMMDRTLLTERFQRNLHEANTWWGESGLRDAYTDLRDYMPHGSWSMFAPRWAAWQGDATLLSEGVEPEEPPEAAQRQMELYEELQTARPEDMAGIMHEILDIAADEFWKMGDVSRPPSTGVIHNRVGNAPREDLMASAAFWDPGPYDMTQMFIREDY